MNEFVLHSKRRNIKHKKQKKEILRNSKLNRSKNSNLSRSNVLSSTPKKQSKRINEK